MENLKYRVTVALAITTFLLFGFCARSVMSAESFLGDVCWRIDVTSPFESSTTLKLGLYKKDGGHFVLYGTAYWQDPLTDVIYTGVVHGNMEVVGNNFFTNLESKGSDEEWQWSENISGTLSIDPFTLSGPFKGYASEDSFTNFEISGTMTWIPCP